jgi:methyl-accepting chemotaxis protein
MARSSEHLDSSAQTEAAGMNLQTDEAKAMAAGITAENAALEEASQSAGEQAEATTEQANQMAQATQDVLEELQEIEEGVEQA